MQVTFNRPVHNPRFAGIIDPKTNAEKIQQAVEMLTTGLSALQVSDLVATINKPDQVPFRAGKLTGGEIFVVTHKASGQSVVDYPGTYKIYYGKPPADVKELTVTSGRQTHHGGSATHLKTQENIDLELPSLNYHRRGPVKVNGTPIAVEFIFPRKK